MPAELSTYHLPECIMRFVNKTDLTILKNSITDITNKVQNSMERHCALEIYMVIKWCKSMLKVLTSANCNLPKYQVKDYRIKNPIKTNLKCVICDLNISTPGTLNKELVKSVAKEEFMRLYSNIGLFNMPEEEYLSNCVKVLENVILLSDLPRVNRSTNGNMEMIKERFCKIYQYFLKNEIEDVQKFINKVMEEYKEALTGEFFLMKSSREREEIEENIKNMMWKDALVDYSYKRLIGFNIPPSQIWLQSIAALLEDDMVIHHCHYSGHIYGYAHKSCNSKLRIQTEIPVKVYAHNASNFDLLFMVKGFKLSDYGCNKINITGTANNIKSVNIGKTTWSDTINFFPASLDALSKSAVKKEQEWIWSDTERILKQSCVAERYLKLSKKDKEEVLKIMLNKGAIPYDMFKNGSEVNYAFFPSKISFVSSLKQSEVDDEVYERMKNYGIFCLYKILASCCLYTIIAM